MSIYIKVEGTLEEDTYARLTEVSDLFVIVVVPMLIRGVPPKLRVRSLFQHVYYLRRNGWDRKLHDRRRSGTVLRCHIEATALRVFTILKLRGQRIIWYTGILRKSKHLSKASLNPWTGMLFLEWNIESAINMIWEDWYWIKGVWLSIDYLSLHSV